MSRFAPILIGCLYAVSLAAAEPSSRPWIDAPELAHLGEAAVGVRTLTLVDKDQPDSLAVDPQTNKAARHDRVLTVDLWYPAQTSPGAVAESYADVMPSEPPAAPLAFSTPGLAVRDARPLAGRHPLVIVSHGYGNATAGMVWLTENLASKGYVVAAIRHHDSITRDALHFSEVLLRRPLDIAFVARSLQQSLAAQGLVDPERTALIGYSMGGYGALTAAGAVLDPQSYYAKGVPGGLLLPIAQGGTDRARVLTSGLKAVVTISPAGGGAGAWGRDGLAGIHVPLFMIAGDKDTTVGYTIGARAFYDAAVNSNRYLLTFKGGGHHLGLIPAPDSMRATVWHLNYFEDMVWRKDRVLGISLHMITAFLDRYVRDDLSRASYLDGLVPDSNLGEWPAPLATHFGDLSPGVPPITVWKGFQRGYAVDLELLHQTAVADPAGATARPAAP